MRSSMKTINAETAEIAENVSVQHSAGSANSALNEVSSALRRCRQPVPARVIAEDDRPVRVTTDRRGYAGGSVVHAAGPWRTSGAWWAGEAGRAGREPRLRNSPVPPFRPVPPILPYWDRDEWDVSLSDGAVYRIFRDRDTDGWFIDGIFD